MRNKRRVADENWSVDDEHKALYVLQHWEEMPGYGYKLVPEHVEIRSLYNPENPGLVQVRCVSLPRLDTALGEGPSGWLVPSPLAGPLLSFCLFIVVLPLPEWVTEAVSVNGWPCYEVRTVGLGCPLLISTL